MTSSSTSFDYNKPLLFTCYYPMIFFPKKTNLCIDKPEEIGILYSSMFPLKRPCPDLTEDNTVNNEYDKNWRCTRLANIKSAKKRILVSQTKAARNKAIRSEVKTSIKKVEAAVAAGDKAVAAAELKNATSVIEAASSKGVYHKNNAARKVSRLAKLVNKIA
jgi:small subunit ribosomal protein S20